MRFKKFSFQKKLYLSCFALNLVLLLICSLAFYHYTTQSLKQNMQDSVFSNTSMLRKDLDAVLTNADNILKELQTNPTLLSESKKITDSADNYFSSHVPVSSAFQNAFRSVLLSQNFNGSIIYVSNYFDNVGVSSTQTGTHAYVKKKNLQDQDEITQLMGETKYVSYVLPHKDFWNQSDMVFSVVRAMRDAYRRYGILELDLDISVLTDLLKDFENPDSYSITLLDPDKNLAYTSSDHMDKNHFYESYQRAASKADSGTFSPNELNLSCYVESPVTGWTFILTTSTAAYLQSMKQMLFVTAVLFFSLFVIISAFLYLVTHRLTHPLKQLTNHLASLEPGRNIRLPQISGDDEITMLTNAVQLFLAEIYDQNQRLTEERKRTLQAHYDTLEAQLNPHFLYNTLSVIGMAGLSSGNTSVSRMCSELANLLRYSLSYTGQSVQLEQEITNAESYLYIMKMRYEDDLLYEWDLDPALNNFRVPKLILQPLLENCFQHGFQQTEYEVPPPWIIKIHSFQDASNWYLSVSNNGAPFHKGKLDQLYERVRRFNLLDPPENETPQLSLHQGFGLENTILRLNIFYHGQEYFQVSSPETEWTTVTIGGPLKNNRDI